jgi:hypothetical protein
MLKRMWFAVPLVLVMYALPSAARAQHEHDHAQGAPASMADMTKMHQQMMAEMKTADGKLDQLVKTMNAATGEARMAAIVDVVNALASQQKAMHDRMGAMHQQMMGGRGMMMPKQ